MLIQRCPDLQELILDGVSSTDPVDVHLLVRGRWPALRKLVLGDVVLDWHSAVNPAAKRPLISFLEAHPELETLAFFGHQSSIGSSDLLAAVHGEALTRVTDFSGTLEQVQILRHKAAIKRLELPDAIFLRESTPLAVSNALASLPWLTSLTISFGLEHGYDNGSMLRAFASACPQLQHLDLTCACKPSFSLVRPTTSYSLVLSHTQPFVT